MGREEGNPNRLEFVIDIKSIIFAIKVKKIGDYGNDSKNNNDISIG